MVYATYRLIPRRQPLWASTRPIPRAIKTKSSPAKSTELEPPIHTCHFDYMMWTHTGQKYATVYEVVKAMYDNEKGLHDTRPL